MSIDVVLANYNHANLLSNAIRALNNQSIIPHRIIIIDDNSSDNSKEVINSELKKYDNIILVNNKSNLGAVKSYNLGLELVSSDYVYFAAADDETFPLLFQKSIEMLQMYPKAAFTCAEAIKVELESGVNKYRPLIRPRQKTTFLSPTEVAKEFRNNDNWIQTGTCVYKTRAIRNVGGFDNSLGAFADSILAKQLSLTYGCIFVKYYGVKWNVSNAGFSKNTMLDLAEFRRVKNNLKTFIISRVEFPDWYWHIYSSRLDSMYYLNIFKEGVKGIEQIDSKYLKQVFYIYSESSSIRQKMINILLQSFVFLKFHPFSFFKLVKSAAIRSFENYKI